MPVVPCTRFTPRGIIGAQVGDRDSQVGHMRSYGFQDDEPVVLIVPDYAPENPSPYPGDIQPGYYTVRGLVELLRTYAEDPEAIRFIADLLEP